MQESLAGWMYVTAYRIACSDIAFEMKLGLDFGENIDRRPCLWLLRFHPVCTIILPWESFLDHAIDVGSDVVQTWMWANVALYARWVFLFCRLVRGGGN